MFPLSKQRIGEAGSFLIMNRTLQAEALCILMSRNTDYSRKTSFEWHVSIGKLTAKITILYLFAN